MTWMEAVEGAVVGGLGKCSVSSRDCRTARAHRDRSAGPRSRTTRRLPSFWRCECANAMPAGFMKMSTGSYALVAMNPAGMALAHSHRQNEGSLRVVRE